MKVYYAPYTRAVRTVWLLNELGLDYELERYKLGEKAMRSPEYLAVNPNGRVPTLDDGDIRLSESTAIAQYLVARHGDGGLARGPDSPDFAAYLQWLHYGEGMIMPPINTIVVETFLLPPERRSQPHADRALRLLNRTLGPVEARLEGREYLVGSFSAADTITGHASIMAEKRGADLSDMPNLKAYNERLQARPALAAAWDA
ncbi:MAG: glutathione S-transferase family protein [Defluviicoccus sp.]|nr:glutathione S-transferase family protein [Defluviicoccus sp.]MDE0382723.1 glutathione S-transferase family protein [Defluviicoccus sp.]